MAVDAAAILDYAATLPETGEKEWGEETVVITFRGRGIGYVTGAEHRLVVKSLLAEREAMVRSDPATFSESWAAGRFGWVRVDLTRVDLDEACELVLEAWRLTAPARLARELLGRAVGGDDAS